MHCYILLLRGINVGGRHTLPMPALRALLHARGAQDVKTYIQSGNAVIWLPTSDPLPFGNELTSAIAQTHGFAPAVMLLSRAQFDAIVQANPFPTAAAEPKTLHVYFLAAAPTAADLALLHTAAQDESFVLTTEAFYLYAPAGIGRSKVAERVERALGVATTARNWRTVLALHALAHE